MSEKKRPVNTNLTITNFNRLEVIAKKLHERGLTTQECNISAAANLIFNLGYHAYLAKYPEANPHIDPEIMQGIIQQAKEITVAQEGNPDV